MKRLLLLPPALALLFAATPAFALSQQCQTVLSLPPDSPYVKAVLQRADDGLEYIANNPGDAIYGTGLDWIQSINAAWSGLIGTNLRVSVQAEDLTRNTACLNFDTVAIQCKMDQVRDVMNANRTRTVLMLMRLQSLLSFLNNRLDQLHKGALDPQYRDPDWGDIQSFDPPQYVFCVAYPGATCTPMSSVDCAAQNGYEFKTESECVVWGGMKGNGQSSSVPDEEMCPYDSDYGPPIANGYGCDTGAMLPRIAFPPVQSEYDALSSINKSIEASRQAAEQLLGVQADIDSLSGNQSQSPPPPQPRKHLTAYGCKWIGGLCANDPSQRCTQDSDCGNNDTCEFPTSICKQNRNTVCINDAQCQINGTDVGPCIPNDGKAASTIALRGPFSINKDQLNLVSQFLAQRLQQANSREYPDYLKMGSEFSSDQSSLASQQSGDLFGQLVRGSMRVLYNAWSLLQGRDEAESFPVTTDPELESAHAIAPLRSAVGDLARLATDKKNGLRSFVIKYAYFLRRSCTYRPCNASLEEVLKIAFSDACFPYTNGDYLNDTPGDPRWVKCVSDAGISLP
ncbi:MAG TPA: hypothetical protein VHA78_04695 [Candidatus Peribacteraceae bacterium]|nr:hypothetical protein [Candidatus Peribacteraceae bacterium]